MALTCEDLNRITMVYMFTRPEAILSALQAAAEVGDDEALRDLLGECKRRRIDVGKLLRDDIARHERLWGKLR